MCREYTHTHTRAKHTLMVRCPQTQRHSYLHSNGKHTHRYEHIWQPQPLSQTVHKHTLTHSHTLRRWRRRVRRVRQAFAFCEENGAETEMKQQCMENDGWCNEATRDCQCLAPFPVYVCVCVYVCALKANDRQTCVALGRKDKADRDVNKEEETKKGDREVSGSPDCCCPRQDCDLCCVHTRLGNVRSTDHLCKHWFQASQPSRSRVTTQVSSSIFGLYLQKHSHWKLNQLNVNQSGTWTG